MSTSTEQATAYDKLRRRSRESLFGLSVQFLLGMAVNLVYDPDNQLAMIVSGIALLLHILVGIGIIYGSVRVLLAARAVMAGEREALWALVVLSVTFLAGIGTMLTGIGWLSYLMATGFLVGAGLIVRTYVIGARAAGPITAAGTAPRA